MADSCIREPLIGAVSAGGITAGQGGGCMSEKSKRGFASMDRERQREIAAKGGRAAHAKGTAHVWSASEAREAGRKGGEVVSQDRLHMSAIGREGGESRSAAVRAARLRRLSEAQAQRATGRAMSAPMDREVSISMGHDGALGSDRSIIPHRVAADHAADLPADRHADRADDRTLDRSVDRLRPSPEQRDMP